MATLGGACTILAAFLLLAVAAVMSGVIWLSRRVTESAHWCGHQWQRLKQLASAPGHHA